MSDHNTKPEDDEKSGSHVDLDSEVYVWLESIKILHFVQNWSAGERVPGLHAYPVGLHVFAEESFLFAEMDVGEETSGNEIGHGVVVSNKEFSTVSEVAVYLI